MMPGIFFYLIVILIPVVVVILGLFPNKRRGAKKIATKD
jgi:hypothetical protein